MRHAARRIDFVSIVEVFQNPIVGFLYGALNAFPLDRSRPDVPTIRTVLDRLARGRVVGIFPEGRLRPGALSMIHTRQMKPGIGRIAKLANAPIVPCAIVDSAMYWNVKSWLPRRSTRYGIIFGQAIEPRDDPGATEQ